MPESSRRNRNRRGRHSPNRSRGPSSQSSSGGSKPKIRPRTWKKVRRWGLYIALTLFAAAIIASFVVQGFAGTGGGGGGTGTGDEVGQRIAAMPLIYPPSNHIPQGTDFEGTYNSTPPTSGPHWGIGWAGCGIFQEELPDEQIVHNMEHGQVIISYNLSDDAEIERLREIARGLPGRRSWMILHPYSKIAEGEVVLTAWRWLDRFQFQGEGEERIRAFYDAHRNNSGVESIPCGDFMS